MIMAQILTIKQILSNLNGVFPIDQAVIEALPKEVTFDSVKTFGKSAWTITGRLVGLEEDGTERQFFVKVAYGEIGYIMLRGEYESSKLIYEKQSDFIPEPFGFGKYYAAQPQTYFYLSEFVDMDITTAPDPVKFTTRLAEMHRISQSPNGKFGFPVQTCDGNRVHVVAWEESWATFYRNLLLGVCKLDFARNGPWPEFERVLDHVVSKIIPILLEPLQEDGKPIKPCLIHGDLWEGNVGIRKETGETLLFDAGSYFAHNEMELGHWRCEFSSVFRLELYTSNYLKNYPAAEPADQFDDRNRLYSLKGAINYSAGHPRSPLRKTAYNNMLYLCEKYAPIDGVDKYDPRIDPSVTGECIVPHLAEGLI
ncbi:Fructosamine kinase-domain-containing protein [Nemania sp. FL0031]|nr:Fructosamine kinase-domain-containing protein [Nemania sp. FL0031]